MENSKQIPLRSNKHKKYICGRRFGHLKVICDGPHVKYRDGHCVHKTTCKCDCGRIVEIKTSELPTRSSCLFCSHSKHGYTAPSRGGHKRLYRIWVNMRYRCSNRNHEAHKYYHDKGVKVCAEWSDFIPFMKWALANGYDDTLQIDRIDGNKWYGPDNCRWVNSNIQQNNKSNVLRFNFGGGLHTITEIGNMTGLNRELLWRRVHDFGKTIEEAVRMGKSKKTS